MRSECSLIVTVRAAGGTANPVNVSYVAPGSDQPYVFTFRADVFHSGKILAIKAASDQDSVAVKLSENGHQAQVSNGYRVNHMMHTCKFVTVVVTVRLGKIFYVNNLYSPLTEIDWQ